MVRSGKERAAPSPLRGAHVAGADDATIQDTRFLQGINRQLRPDAPSHQLAASRAAAAKRKATAMAGEEKAAADRARADRRKPPDASPFPLRTGHQGARMRSHAGSNKSSPGTGYCDCGLSLRVLLYCLLVTS